MAEQADMQSTQTPKGAPERKPRAGVVEAISGDKTIRVGINTLVKHPMYGKYVRTRTRLLVHDEKNEATVGDLVAVIPCRPLSKRKSWRMVRVVRQVDTATLHTEEVAP